MSRVVVSGRFDQLQTLHLRWLQEAARLGPVQALLWSDALVRAKTGADPVQPAAERRYVLAALRWVERVDEVDELADPDTLPLERTVGAQVWVVCDRQVNARKADFCGRHGLTLQHIPDTALGGYPEPTPAPASGRPKVIVTGCYDWFHSGHVRFFEEASEHGELYVAVGNDANVRLLKGEGHPLFCQEERRYLVGAVRYVHQALVTSGSGWMDAAPDIERLRPEIYVVNEDGDKPEKRAFCAAHGLEYRVLKRLPKEGLPRRQSTDLRGF